MKKRNCKVSFALLSKLFLTPCLFFICFQLHAQDNRKTRIEQIFSFGAYRATGLPASIDEDGSFSFQNGFLVSIPLKEKYKLETGLTYHWTRNYLDGHFQNENNTVVFKTTPDDFKQHSLQMDRVNLPVKIKRVFDPQASIGFGLLASYYVSALSKYKISDTKYEVKGVPFRRFHLSPGLDFDVKMGLPKSYFIIGASFYYQATAFIAERSFRPILFELRFQNPIFNNDK